MKRKITFLLLSAFAAIAAVSTAPAQETKSTDERVAALESEVAKLKKLKISGYIQAQGQWGERAASMKVGTANENPEKSFNRLGIRRGRIKFTYEEGVASAVFQLDVTEKGVGFKDAYLNIKDPWCGSMALKAGVFDRPFGYEISYSSSTRESPERSTVFQTLFPDERDLGAMLVLQAPASSPWSILKLEAGLFAGNGIKQETDRKRDFIGHISLAKMWGSFSIGAGVSYYNGKVLQSTQNVLTMKGREFVADSDESNRGKFAKREYFGLDAEFSLKSVLGQTKLHGEYLSGQQPGLVGSTKSPNAAAVTGDTYIRDFTGGYVMLVQSLGKSPLAIVGKYDWYDPNTKISKDDVGQGGTTLADLSQNTLGFGAIWYMNVALRLTGYYEINRNEKSANVEGMTKDLKNDLFTLRLQYKF